MFYYGSGFLIWTQCSNDTPGKTNSNIPGLLRNKPKEPILSTGSSRAVRRKSLACAVTWFSSQWLWGKNLLQ